MQNSNQKHQLQESDTNNEVNNTFQHLAMNDIYYTFLVIFSLLKRALIFSSVAC